MGVHWKTWTKNWSSTNTRRFNRRRKNQQRSTHSSAQVFRRFMHRRRRRSIAATAMIMLFLKNWTNTFDDKSVQWKSWRLICAAVDDPRPVWYNKYVKRVRGISIQTKHAADESLAAFSISAQFPVADPVFFPISKNQWKGSNSGSNFLQWQCQCEFKNWITQCQWQCKIHEQTRKVKKSRRHRRSTGEDLQQSGRSQVLLQNRMEAAGICHIFKRRTVTRWRRHRSEEAVHVLVSKGSSIKVQKNYCIAFMLVFILYIHIN